MGFADKRKSSDIIAHLRWRVSMRRILTVFISILFLLLFQAYASICFATEWRKCPGQDRQCRQIADEKLKSCIAEKTQKDFDALSDADYLGITSLLCHDGNIENISGIENLLNLVELDLRNNQIVDISPLADLKSLTHLYLSHNQISDISPVAELSRLLDLFLEENLVEDIGPLKNLKNLEMLVIGNNQVSDLQPLASLVQLPWVSLYNNQVKDISPLASLYNLDYLDLSGNSISDIETLKNLKKLDSVYLQDNNISDIDVFLKIKIKRILFLGNNQINDISPLANLTELKILNLNSNNISDISALKNLTKLQRLTLDNNLVSSIKPLADSKELVYVSLINNCIKSISDIKHLKDVTGMEYQHNLCSSPNLMKKAITLEWLAEQISRQCIEYGDNKYSLKIDYEYYPDGIYYLYDKKDKNGEPEQTLVCRLPWNDNFDDLLLMTEKGDNQESNYEIYNMANDLIYVKNSKLTGCAVRYFRPNGFYDVINELKIFDKKYEIRRNISGQDRVYFPRNNGYVIRAVKKGDYEIVQYLEKKFFDAEIALK